MSFLKQEPPKPMLAFRNFAPIRLSRPAAAVTSLMFASVFSHSAEMLFTEETRWASRALETSLVNSLLQRLVVMIRSRGTQFA